MEDFLKAEALLQFAYLTTLKIYITDYPNHRPPRFDSFVKGDCIYKLLANRFFGILMTAAEKEGKECKVRTIIFVVQDV
jgi:hypothetical protein